MKKVLIVATAGGFVPKFENNDVKLLAELGYELHYAADFNNRVYEFDDEYWNTHHIITHQIDFVKKLSDVKDNLRAYRSLKELIRRVRPDMVHCHNPIAAALTRAAIGRKSRIKVIYTAHGFHFYRGASPLSIIYRLAERLFAHYTDVLVTINREDYHQALKFHLKEGGSVVMIPGVGVDLDKFVPKTAGLPEKEAVCDSNDKVYRIVSVGELNTNKNHKTAVRAVALLNNDRIRYDIYGKGPARQELEALIARLGLYGRVRLCGYCDDVAAVLRDTDCFVFPSIREGLGMAALEAMACGVPVIALDQRGTRQYMRHGRNGYICDNEPAAIAGAIDRLMKLPPDELATMCECARDTAGNFGQNNTIEIMRRVYRRVDMQVRSKSY